MTSKKLTAKMEAFVAVYDGNGTEAARKAGYKGSDNTLAQNARDLLSNPQIAEAIRARQDKRISRLILTREQRQEFWSTVTMDPEAHLSDRLRASELLGKSEADFTAKVEVSGKLTLEQLVASAGSSVEGADEE
jgi:phage terminase small subunit